MTPRLLLAGALLALSTPAAAQQLAFPGAEGAGRFAAGGRGGRVIAVTTLADSGPGSLRAAVEAEGPRTIVFRTAGTIRLASPLVIRHGRVTIAGQSAPGDGITLRDHGIDIAADDVIVRYIRSRLGAASRTQEDAFTISRGRRIIVDHVSASWSVDETLSSSALYDAPDAGIWDLTVQWSVIANSLRRSVHQKGVHGFGSLVRIARGARVSYHHNLWANHFDRMPRPGNYSPPADDPQGGRVEFRSNVFYNWGRDRSGYNVDKGTHIAYAFIDNSYIAGPDSTGNLAFEEQNPLARAFFAGNRMNGVEPADQAALVTGTIPAGYWLASPPDVGPVAADPADMAEPRVLACAGAAEARDAVDRAVVAGVRDRSGRIIDNEAEDGGWPRLRPGRPLRDRDGDGMPDAWERAHGLDPARDDGALDPDGDGWTHLEDYLNGLVATPCDVGAPAG
ncbi:pectate lyase (plasmid) [Croceibacterium sp. TMG7-5b_MA50]|uniref:pectate lyase family protein n=1 Tax=Croceibacterium sp. TMG7-5b_MA50 TaxID=3121290 RepID=UPI003221A498